MITFHSLNTWSGGCPNFHPFIKHTAERSDYIALQEVHHAIDTSIPTGMTPADPGSRQFPLRPYLRQELDEMLAAPWHTVFAPHLAGFHDLERDPRLLYGQYSAVRTTTFRVIKTSCRYIYGQYNQFNTEHEGGVPCGKVAIGQLLQSRRTGVYLVVINVHGFWSKYGKRDSRERLQQNRNLNTLVQALCPPAAGRPVHVIVMGDLNYTSRMMTLYDLACQPCFDGGGVVLNHAFGVTETRTDWYQKEVREADFVIVSRSLLPYVSDFRVILADVPSDHGLLELTLNL